MKKLLLIALVSLSACHSTLPLQDTCIPDTVRVYVNQPDTTFGWYASQYIKAFEDGSDQAQNDRAYIRNQSHLPDSLRAAYEARTASQLTLYQSQLAKAVYDYFKRLLNQ